MTDITIMTISWLISSIVGYVFTGICETVIMLTVLSIFSFSFVNWIT